jgi:hypothetical protein
MIGASIRDTLTIRPAQFLLDQPGLCTDMEGAAAGSGWHEAKFWNIFC